MGEEANQHKLVWSKRKAHPNSWNLQQISYIGVLGIWQSGLMSLINSHLILSVRAVVNPRLVGDHIIANGIEKRERRD